MAFSCYFFRFEACVVYGGGDYIFLLVDSRKMKLLQQHVCVSNGPLCVFLLLLFLTTIVGAADIDLSTTERGNTLSLNAFASSFRSANDESGLSMPLPHPGDVLSNIGEWNVSTYRTVAAVMEGLPHPRDPFHRIPANVSRLKVLFIILSFDFHQFACLLCMLRNIAVLCDFGWEMNVVIQTAVSELISYYYC